MDFKQLSNNSALSKMVSRDTSRMLNKEYLTPIPQEVKKTIYNQVIRVVIPLPYERQYFKLDCPFTPDIIEVRCADGVGTGAKIVELRSNMIDSNQSLVILSRDNIYSPTFEYTNLARNDFRGTYSLDAYDLNTGDANPVPITGTQLIAVIHFKFIRYGV